jgi:hypothetical protein
LRTTRSVVLSGAVAMVALGGLLTAMFPPTVSAAATDPHPVRPQVQRLQLAGVDRAALAELRQQDAGAAPAVLTTRRPTESFRLLGVSWMPDVKAPRVAVEVRTGGAKGWSQWQQLGVEGVVAAPRGALAPSDDDAGTRAGTEPIYTGPSSGVQVRVDLISGELPADLRVDLIDPAAPTPTRASLPSRCPRPAPP